MTKYQEYTYRHGVGWSTWHIVLVTKYRHKVFKDKHLEKLCEILIHESSRRYGFEIDELEIVDDHVHMILNFRPSSSPSNVVQQIKGYTSRLMFKLELQKLQEYYWKPEKKRSLWSDGKFISSIGHTTLDEIREYVKNQKAHHAKSFN